MSSGTENAIPAPQPFDQAEGVTPSASTDGRSGFLSDVIIELGLAPREIVDESVDQARLVGQMPERILVDSGAITDEQLAIAIAERNGLPYVDLSRFRVDPRATRLIDPDTARRYRALPIAVDAGGALVVALSDPMDALAVSDIGVITKSEVRTAVASSPGIDALLHTLPASKRNARLSAHGPDGLGAARVSESGAWTLSRSISTPEPAPPPDVMPDPMLEPPPESVPPPDAESSPALEGRIEALVAAALEKRLDGTETPAPAADETLVRAEQQLAETRAELAQAREDASQARAEVEALSARIQDLEHAPAPVHPSPDEPHFEGHLARALRELETGPGSPA